MKRAQTIDNIMAMKKVLSARKKGYPECTKGDLSSLTDETLAAVEKMHEEDIQGNHYDKFYTGRKEFKGVACCNCEHFKPLLSIGLCKKTGEKIMRHETCKDFCRT